MEDGATLENGASAVWLVEEASGIVHEPVPIPLQRTEAWIALETTRRSRRATLRLVKWKKLSNNYCVSISVTIPQRFGRFSCDDVIFQIINYQSFWSFSFIRDKNLEDLGVLKHLSSAGYSVFK